MLNGKPLWLPLALSLLCVIAHAQEDKLEPGQVIEREIACGQSHTFQLTLQAGQFVRFRLDQRSIDAALILTAPDVKQVVEMDMTGVADADMNVRLLMAVR
jgi:hypothetical protein